MNNYDDNTGILGFIVYSLLLIVIGFIIGTFKVTADIQNNMCKSIYTKTSDYISCKETKKITDLYKKISEVE